MEADNIKVVQEAYAAFGRGDIPALLGCLTEDIAWRPVFESDFVMVFTMRDGKVAGFREFADSHAIDAAFA
jgi:ketosteroid isomerase-like protein